MKRKFADSLCLIIVLCLGCSLDLEHQQPDELGGDASLRRMPFLPNAYMRVTQGANGSYSHQGSISEAIDWSSPDFEDRGMAVTAMQSGTIVNIVKGLPDSRSSGFGNIVEVLTSEGDVDRLAHCREVIVRPGEAVKQGQVLCTLGTSGNSTGTHVHSDRRRSGTSQTLELNFFESGGVPREGRNYSSRNTGPYDRSYWEHGGPSMLGEPSEEARWYFDYVPCNDTDGDANFVCTNEEAHRTNVHVLHLRGGAIGRGAIVYDALRGARNAVIIHGQFYDWWMAYAGPRSEFGVPISEEYLDASGNTRQDGTGGYLTWDGISLRFHSWQDTVSPGEFASGWDNAVSYLFVEAYKELGASRWAGEPVAQFGNPAEVHVWPGTRYLIQDYNFGELGWLVIMYDPDNADYGGTNQAIPIVGLFWKYYRTNDGITRLRAPISASYADSLTGYERMDWETGRCTVIIDSEVSEGTQSGAVCEISTTPPSDPDPTEICDGADNDGDGLSDEDFDCLAGSSEPCVTTCGTAGVRFCNSSCVWHDCIPIEGSCDDPPTEDDVLRIEFTPYDSGSFTLVYHDWSALTDGTVIRSWAEQCRATSASSIECLLSQPGSSHVEFNINYGERWACESSSHVITGAVIATWQTTSLTVLSIDNGHDGCNFRVEIP